MEQAKKNRTIIEKVVGYWHKKPLVSTACVLLLMVILQTIALGFDFPSFGDWLSNWGKNWLNILRNNAGIGIIALGMTLVIVSGGIDLSVGSVTVAVGAVLMVMINALPDGVLTSAGITGLPAAVIGIIAALAVGIAIGGINGFLISKCGLPAFIATLGMMKICRSVTQHCMQTNIVKVPADFLLISNAKIGGEMVLPILYWIVAVIIIGIVAKMTPYGRQLYAVGSNERSAHLAGVRVERVKLLVYMISGLMVAIAAVMQVSRLGSMDYANAGEGYEMDAISAAVVGGASMSGGCGSVLGTVMGTLIIAVMNNLLNLLGVPPFLREAFKGLIVIVAVLLQRKEKSL